MTTNEFRAYLNNKFGMSDRPVSFEIDHETYANICQDIFLAKAYRATVDEGMSWANLVEISLGPNYGIMFKGVELILKRTNE